MNKADFPKYCKERHDIDCNQKYGDNLPYSFHLEQVVNQATKFRKLLPDNNDFFNAILGCWGHDLIEDARVTYNDIKDKVGEEIADIIYCCTEDKGKTRLDRHSTKFLKELSRNRIAVFVKLCDIIANVKYGLLNNSTQFDRARKEHQRYKEYLYVNREYKPMWDYLDKIFEL